MIQKVLYSNDKSTIRLIHNDIKKLWKPDIECNELFFTKLLYKFADYMKNHADKVIKATHKYKAEFYFKFYVITQSVRKPFTIYVGFNYIEYLNKSGFNYIIKSSELNDLKPFIQRILEEYLEYMEEFCEILKEKYEINNNLSDRKIVSLFERYILSEYKKSRELAYVQLSVTCDIHFKDSVNKGLFFNVIKNIKKEWYKVMVIENETVFFYPFNRNTQSIKRDIPKIRFYDKRADTKYRYFKRKKEGKKYYFLLKEFDDVTFSERFEYIDILSQEGKRFKEKLESEFYKALEDLKYVIRFELEFNQKALEKRFKTASFYDLQLSNKDIISNYLQEILDMETTEFKETVFHDLLTGKKEVIECKNVKVDTFSCSGDLLECFNQVIKYAQPLLNTTLKDYTPLSTNSMYSRLKRLRYKGMIKGYGSNIRVNQPYASLLDIYTHYLVYQTFLPNYDMTERVTVRERNVNTRSPTVRRGKARRGKEGEGGKNNGATVSSPRRHRALR